MIPIFDLTPEQQKELDDKLKEAGPYDVMNPGPHMGIGLRFHEDIHIKLLSGNQDQP
jgi:hypothetical protein